MWICNDTIGEEMFFLTHTDICFALSDLVRKKWLKSLEESIKVMGVSHGGG